MPASITVQSHQALERVLSLEIVRVTERAAVSAARLRGHGAEKAADKAAVDAMRRELNKLRPMEPTPHMRLASIYLGLKRTDDAVRHLEAVGDPLQHRRHRHLDQRYVQPRTMVAGLIEPPRAAIRQQPRLFEFDARFRNPALHGVILHHGPSEGGALRRPHHHQFDQEFAQPDRAHAMENAGRPQPDLRDPEALAFGTE